MKQPIHHTTWWRHQMETFSALLANCAWNSSVTGELPSQRPVTRRFSVFFIRAWINGWVNNHEAGDLRRHRAHYEVIVMKCVIGNFYLVWVALWKWPCFFEYMLLYAQYCHETTSIYLNCTGIYGIWSCISIKRTQCRLWKKQLWQVSKQYFLRK